ncbi:MAG: 30S ribosomal protein S6 [Ignavibacteriales bacterium]|nr:30S ribosomal protein S6 [Ignavibacteriales bacterium]
MQNANRVYETTFIVNASLDDTQINTVIDKVKEFILKHAGEIRELVLWGRKRFQYTIQKKNNGFYVIIEFLAPGDLIAKLERHYFLDENIIRYLTIVLDKKALKARTAASLLIAEQTAESAAPMAVKTEAPVAAAGVVAPAENRLDTVA